MKNSRGSAGSTDPMGSPGSGRWPVRARLLAALAVTAAVAALVPTVSADAAPAPAAVPAGLDYVAMGSSFAAGPGIPPAQPGSPSGCARSDNNYPSIVARDLGANLTDVSCSGATTANILTDGQAGQPPQIEAVTPSTQFVTVTIGGNDVDYLGSINVYSCQTSGGTNCGSVDQDGINKSFEQLTDRLKAVVNGVHAVAPQAKVLLVTYFTILPDAGACTGVPLTGDQLAFEHSIETRLAAATSTAANETGAQLGDLAGASHGHDACAADPWVEKYTAPAGRSTYHPNEAGMNGAAALVKGEVASAVARGTR